MKVKGTRENGATDVGLYLKSFQDRPLNPQKLDHGVTGIKRVGSYDSAGYRFIEQNGRAGLLVQVVEKSDAPPMFQPAFEVDGSQAGNVDFTMGTRFTFMDVAGFRSEWRTDLLLGDTYGNPTELYPPFRAESPRVFAPPAAAPHSRVTTYAGKD